MDKTGATILSSALYFKNIHATTFKNAFIFTPRMLPDYPHKIFGDKRSNYILLLLTLAMDA